MGRMQAEEFADAVDDGTIAIETALRWHLQSNHYPPVHEAFVPVALDAIGRANVGDWAAEITMPNGVTLTVGEIVEGLHLEGFMEPDPIDEDYPPGFDDEYDRFDDR